MIDRNIYSPTLCALVLTFLGSLALPAHADLSNPGSASSTSQPATLEAIQNPAPAAVMAPTTVSPTASVTAPVAAATKSAPTYIVVKGDSWSSIAQKFKTTRKKLKDLNNTTASTVKPGQILLVPALKTLKTALATTATAKEKIHHQYPMAQPVQDFDIPASTFGSCPVPLPTPEDDPQTADTTSTTEKPAPIAKLVSPSEMMAEPPPEAPAPARLTITAPSPKPIAPVTVNPPQPAIYSNHLTNSKTTTPYSSSQASSSASYSPPTARFNNRIPNQSLTSNPQPAIAANDWGNRFLQQARLLGDKGIEYDDDWRPPGESHSWVMDCSNTSRYLYKVTTGLELPRTASDQYYYLHLQGKAWDVPLRANGFVDTDYLRSHLKPGDLLFWENTYRPERQPPITHVMVYIGTNAQGQWLMAGSQSSRGGEHNRRNGGPDVYVFRPSQPCGGYTTWMGLVHHQGRFCAFGRPLEADPTKLSVATDN